MVGIHAGQRWFNGSWLVPAEKGYSRAIPLRWLPAFTEKSQPQTVAPCKEWPACVQFLQWVRQQFVAHQRPKQALLMVGDGHYDNLNLWRSLPQEVTLLARSAKNRVLYQLPDATMHGNHKYGERAPTPQTIWTTNRNWRQITLQVRGKARHLQVCVRGAFLRKGAPDCPLFLLVVRGKQRKTRSGRLYRRPPLPFLVNAVPDEQGHWQLPLPLETLLFWAWQRWEVEVCHRELKTTFGLGHKQCFNPYAAILSVQWSALGVLPDPAGRLPHLWPGSCSCRPYPLVAWLRTLVADHFAARFSCCLLGYPPFPTPLHPNTDRLGRKTALSHGPQEQHLCRCPLLSLFSPSGDILPTSPQPKQPSP
jgi:hypothetical protein